ncbi:MAG: UDP-N-acetylmuramoyl-tripeptide--D-alanyl-D-alanine ligase [Roseburia sp.]
MKNLTLKNIAKVCGGTYFGPKEDLEKEVAGAVIDSRQIEKDYLFIAVKGERVDGHKFIPDVFKQGALAVLSEQKLENPSGAYILVESTLMAMKKLAKFYRESLDIKVVGITGSVGKTSTKEMIASVLEQKYRVLKTEGNFNNEIGLPLTIFKIHEEHQVAVLEMGISDFGEMHRLAEMAQPDVCVITNIGICHLENLGDRDGILRAKTESFEHMQPNGTVILNGDDDKLSTKTIVNGKPVIFYGIGQEPKQVTDGEKEVVCASKEVYATEIEALGLTGVQAVLHAEFDSAEGNKKQEELQVKIPIAGEHNVYNALAALCVGRTLGLSAEEIKRGIESVRTISGRSNLVEKDGVTVIDDCYNANPVSMKASIDVLSKAAGRKVAVLGDMGELGTEEKELHYGVGAYFEGKNIDALFCTGTLSKEMVRAIREKEISTEVFYFDEKSELIAQLKQYKKPGDTILVKASHFMGFPEIVSAILED